LKVLLVDDEQELISTLAQRLSFRGIEADWVTTGDEALEKIKTGGYDLAVLDVKMPGLSGIDLGNAIHEIRPDVKLIFMTGHGSTEDFEAGSQTSGSGFYLIKPVDIDTLMAKMEEALASGGN
jgi:DNA-binding response OmpR family regulator